MARFFAGLETPAPITSLADVVAFNNEDPANRMPYGQRFVEWSAETDITAEEYARILATAQGLADNWITTILEENDVDVLVSGMSYAGNAGAANVPALTIPAGLDPAGTAPGRHPHRGLSVRANALCRRLRAGATVAGPG